MGKVLSKGGRIVTAVEDYIVDILMENSKSLLERRNVQGKIKVESTSPYVRAESCLTPQSRMASIIGNKVPPCSESVYSTRGGTSANTFL